MTRRPSAAERRARAEARKAERAAVDDPAVVLEAAAAFLAVRPRSVDETRRRLRHQGYAEAPVEVVLGSLLAYGYLDDEAFARGWVESRDRARPRGRHALRRELTLKGIDRETIDVVLAEREAGHLETDEAAAASPTEEAPDGGSGQDPEELAAGRLLARKAAALAREADPRKRRQRAYALLARNGFAPDICARVAASVVDQGASDEVTDGSGEDV